MFDMRAERSFARMFALAKSELKTPPALAQGLIQSEAGHKDSQKSNLSCTVSYCVVAICSLKGNKTKAWTTGTCLGCLGVWLRFSVFRSSVAWATWNSNFAYLCNTQRTQRTNLSIKPSFPCSWPHLKKGLASSAAWEKQTNLAICTASHKKSKLVTCELTML